jgi:hypothetical protein
LLVVAIVGAQNFQSCVLPTPAILPHLFNFWDYWYAVVGAFLGALIALGVERHRRRGKQKLSLENLRQRVAHNHNLINDILGFFNSGRVSFFKLDPDGLNLWIAESAELLPKSLLDEIETYRHELYHINSKLFTLYSSVEIVEALQGASAAAGFRAGLISKLDLVVHLVEESKRAANILSKMSS